MLWRTLGILSWPPGSCAKVTSRSRKPKARHLILRPDGMDDKKDSSWAGVAATEFFAHIVVNLTPPWFWHLLVTSRQEQKCEYEWFWPPPFLQFQPIAFWRENRKRSETIPYLFMVCKRSEASMVSDPTFVPFQLSKNLPSTILMRGSQWPFSPPQKS